MRAARVVGAMVWLVLAVACDGPAPVDSAAPSGDGAAAGEDRTDVRPGATPDAPDAPDARADVEPGLPGCGGLPRIPYASACVGGGEPIAGPVPEGLTRTYRGRVIATGEGVPDEEPELRAPCWFQAETVGHYDRHSVYARPWFRLQDEREGGPIVTVGLQLPPDVPLDVRPLDVRVGDELAVELQGRDDHYFEFWPPLGRLTIHRADGALVLWLAEAPAADELTTPADVAVERGAAVCRGSDDCGGWLEYDQVVTVGAVSAALPRGGVAVVGPYRVQHLGEAEQTAPGGCVDWFVARSRVLVTGAAP